MWINGNQQQILIKTHHGFVSISLSRTTHRISIADKYAQAISSPYDVHLAAAPGCAAYNEAAFNK